jgi:hypothetical protein
MGKGFALAGLKTRDHIGGAMRKSGGKNQEERRRGKTAPTGAIGRYVRGNIEEGSLAPKTPLGMTGGFLLALKRKGREACAARPTNLRNGLERLNVGSLQALGAPDNLEFNGLTLIERAIAVRLNRGEMDENVLAALALDETKAFAGVKPLHCSLFFHRCVPLII